MIRKWVGGCDVRMSDSLGYKILWYFPLQKWNICCHDRTGDSLARRAPCRATHNHFRWGGHSNLYFYCDHSCYGIVLVLQIWPFFLLARNHFIMLFSAYIQLHLLHIGCVFWSSVFWKHLCACSNIWLWSYRYFWCLMYTEKIKTVLGLVWVLLLGLNPAVHLEAEKGSCCLRRLPMTSCVGIWEDTFKYQELYFQHWVLQWSASYLLEWRGREAILCLGKG